MEEQDSKEGGHCSSNRFKVTLECTRSSNSSSCRRPICYCRRRRPVPSSHYAMGSPFESADDRRRRRRRPVPSSHYAMGSPSESATATATGTVTGSTATRSLWPTRRFRRGPRRDNSQFGGTYAFSAVGTGHSPGGSASTHHDPFALLRDERRRHRLYGQINTINALYRQQLGRGRLCW